jgi:hypothetical protein
MPEPVQDELPDTDVDIDPELPEPVVAEHELPE